MIKPVSFICSLRSKQKKYKTYTILLTKNQIGVLWNWIKNLRYLAINTHIHILLDVDRLWCRDREWNEWLFDGITDVVAEFFDDFIQILRGFVIHGDLVWWH